jgi:hypothetical protein
MSAETADQDLGLGTIGLVDEGEVATGQWDWVYRFVLG